MKIDENKTHHYYSNPDQSLDFVEESYYDNYGKLLQCKLNITSQNLNISVVQPELVLQPTHRKMPAIQLPKFDGRSTQRIEVRDLFKALVADFHYSGVEKLSYLKECLSEEPLSLIKTIAVTEPNFVFAWNKLIKQYDNNKTIIYAHVNCIISTKQVNKESSSALKQLWNEMISAHIRIKLMYICNILTNNSTL